MLAIMVGLYAQYSDIQRKSVAMTSFLEITSKIEKRVNRKDNIVSAIMHPDYILKLKSVDYGEDNVIYDATKTRIPEGITFANLGSSDVSLMSSDYNDYLLVREDDDYIANDQLEFFEFAESSARYAGNTRYLLFISSKEDSTSSGYRYPYKIYTLVDLGPLLYRGWRITMKEDPATAKRFLAIILKPVTHGYLKNIELERDNAEVINIIKNVTMNRDSDSAFTVWDKNKYDIKVKNISISNQVKTDIENSIANIEKIRKNIEDWALIQARIAAYDTLNGDNLDKDYFITCTTTDSDACDTGDVYIDTSRTLMSDNSKNSNELENSTNNGFIVCQSSSDTCSGPSMVINTDCIDDIIMRDYEGDDVPVIKVSKALPISRPSNDGTPHKFGKAIMKNIFAVTKKSSNEYNMPIYFSNSDSFEVEMYNGSGEVYSEDLNVPIKNMPGNPPYIAKLFTIFPFYIGGHYVKNASGVMELKNSDGWGIYSVTVFAHVF